MCHSVPTTDRKSAHFHPNTPTPRSDERHMHRHLNCRYLLLHYSILPSELSLRSSRNLSPGGSPPRPGAQIACHWTAQGHQKPRSLSRRDAARHLRVSPRMSLAAECHLLNRRLLEPMLLGLLRSQTTIRLRSSEAKQGPSVALVIAYVHPSPQCGDRSRTPGRFRELPAAFPEGSWSSSCCRKSGRTADNDVAFGKCGREASIDSKLCTFCRASKTSLHGLALILSAPGFCLSVRRLAG
mmetsp:Transcript_16314/g.39063  ORF Transcript_16314/g.39063 Transcript_16314/m.39063 type:complete len:240 (+) Transcript_16314:5022-5741(+)